MTDAATLNTDDLKASVARMFARKRRVALAVPVLIALYLVYIFFAFDLPGLAARARLDNAAILVADSYSYKTHVTLDNRADQITVAIEGQRKGTYAKGTEPDWVKIAGDTAVVTLPRGAKVEMGPQGMHFTVPNYGEISARIDADNHVVADLPPGPVPDWISASNTRLGITTPYGRVNVTRSKTEVFRYFLGWEMFFFTLDSPYSGLSIGQLADAVLTGDRIDPNRGNLAGMWQDFWGNDVWNHGNVAKAMFETMLMAFLGTMSAAILALPLAFLSARNFTPLMGLRFGVRRVFDFLRGVDGLIWTIILTRAFGLGPLTGTLAIMLTDTGSFGKIFSEALENVDERQIEGIRATGANPVQRYRFGVIPQLMPVLLSQVLYFLESNTRSATVIGAIVGGGIGLLLTQAINTQKDWEQVAYYILLILAMVMLMDWISGLIRRRLIKGK
ncbi:MAG: phosphonate ABC transporter, permease protein PhnE [Rhodobacteraceae bacterium]|nr:phosphonate ABC transporter, permease protein PhnE [Paracoccaceae bacterium]